MCMFYTFINSLKHTTTYICKYLQACNKRKRLLSFTTTPSGSGPGKANCVKCCSSDVCNSNGCGETGKINILNIG